VAAVVVTILAEAQVAQVAEAQVVLLLLEETERSILAEVAEAQVAVLVDK
jgi:hypothetical protein